MQTVPTTLTLNGPLQAAFLTVKENRDLQQTLKLEYAKIDYICFVNEILFSMNTSDASLAMRVCDELLFMLNKILLDNIFRYIAMKTSHDFMVLLAHRTFSKDIYVNPFYVNQIIESIGLYVEDKTEIENMIVRRLQTYIDEIYTKNAESMNVALLASFDVMYRNLQHLNIGYYKFELMNYVQPILLFTERLNENYLYS